VTDTPASANDVRVLMLLFSQRKHQFMGLIPTDQGRFLQGIRSVVSKHRQQQDRTRMQNPGGAVFSSGQQPNSNVAAPGQQVSPPLMNTSMPTATTGGVGMVGGPGGVTGMNISLGAPMMAGAQVQHNQQMQPLQQQQPGGASGITLHDHEQRTNLFQSAMAADHQRQFLAQQQQQQQQQLQHHQRLQQQQQQQQQQQLQQQQLQQQQQQQLQQTMQANQPLRHLLQQQQLRVQHQQQQHQQLMMQQQQQLRGRLPGPQAGTQQGMQSGMGQMQPGQNFGSLGDDLGFDLLNN
jgi:hypothetical protein